MDVLRPERHAVTSLPNFPFQCNPSRGNFDGVAVSPMTKPARKPESMMAGTAYRFRPMFSAGTFPIWLGEDWGQCHGEGGDVQPTEAVLVATFGS